MPIKAIGYAFLSCTIFAQSFFLSVLPQQVYAAEVPSGLVEQEEQVESYLVISAVQITGGTGKTGEDFIELFNPTSEPFDLNGFRLVKRTAAGTTDTVIKSWAESTVVPAFHFYVWANSNFSTIALTPDATSTATLADNNGIALRYGASDVGEVWDSVAWGSTANVFENVSAQNPTANESLVRSDLFIDNSNYTIQPSNVRNSSEEQLPPVTEEDEDDAPPEDDPPIEDEEDEEDEVEEQENDTDDDEEVEQESEPVEMDIRITELLPNPSGSDTGFEKIELYNAGDTSVNLDGYKLDDVDDSQAISSNALTMEDVEIEKNSYKAITLPAGSFSLNNTGGDFVTLFNPTGEGIATVYYEGTSPEGKSYSLFNNNEWFWAEPTFGKSNGNPPEQEDNGEEDEDEDENNEELDGDYDNLALEITEIFPQPPSGTNEFVEVLNAGTKTAQLSQVEIFVGERKKVLPEFELEPGEYFVIEQSGLPVQLRNSGQTVALKYNQSVVTTVTYPAAVEGASFAKFEDGFLWTTKITQKKDNILEIPEAVKKEVATKTVAAPKAATKKATTKTAATKKTTASAKTPATNSVIKPETSTKPEEQAKQAEDQQVLAPAQSKAPVGRIIAMGAAAVSAGLFALYKLVFTGGAE